MDYLDTGALYRAVAVGLNGIGIKPEDSDEQISNALGNMTVSFSGGKAYLNGKDVSGEIRTPEAGHLSSVFSARRPVRELLHPVQRSAAKSSDLVAEGRDMTTVVFKDAWRKFYLDASVEARSRRRFEQLRQNGVHISMEEATKDVSERDKRDSSRDLAPLRVADDAIYVDSSDMTLEEAIKTVLDAVRSEKAKA
jgi:cytidylate kinase